MTTPLPLFNWPVLATEDARVTCSHMRANLRPNKIWFPEKPKLDFMHNKVTLDSTSLNCIHYGSEVNIEVPVTEHIYLAILTVNGNAVFEQNHSITKTQPGDIYLINPLFPLEISLSSDFVQLTVQMDGRYLKRYISGVTGYQIKEPLIFEPVNEGRLKNDSSYKSFIEMLCRDINTPQSPLLNKQVSGNLERTLTSLLLTEFPNNYSEYLREDTQTSVPYYVRRAQSYIHENICNPFTMEQLASTSGVSTRSLQQGFKNTLGTTPMSYARTMRLELARKQLLAASEDGSSVTDIAYACGFAHLSKFAQYYKEHFNESPMETKMYQGKNRATSLS